jgi:hypothetical protein
VPCKDVRYSTAGCACDVVLYSSRASSLKTKKDVDNAIIAATSIAREIGVVRAKRQRFHQDPVLHALTSNAANGFLRTFEESSRADPDFRKFPPAGQALQPLTTALLESGLQESKARYRSDSYAYNALSASQALLALLRREYALAETLLAVTTTLSSPATQTTITSSLKMSDTAVVSLTSLCEQMRASSGPGTVTVDHHAALAPPSAAASAGAHGE